MGFSAAGIEKVSEIIIKELIDKGLIRLKDQRAKLKLRIQKVIADDKKKEEALDKEVNQLIEQNKSIVGNESLDYNKMFTMIKVKLAKEKGIIL